MSSATLTTLASTVANRPKPSAVMDKLLQLGWVRYFKPAIKGQFHFLPRGTVVFNLMHDFLKTWVKKELNSLEIRTPIMYDFLDQSIQAESQQFDERCFQTQSYNKQCVFRPGGDYGVMSLMADSVIHENHLPISLFEMAQSFRKNLTGELAGLLRANIFTLLDHHVFAATTGQAWEEFSKTILAQAKLADYFKFDWELSIDINSQFYLEHSHQIETLQKTLRRTIGINKLDQLKNYWTAQYYFVDKYDDIGFCDGQYDLFNGKNYKINFIANENHKKLPVIICHASFGSVERWIFKLVHNAMASNGFIFPIWLTPIQIRIIDNQHPNSSLLENIKQEALKRGIRLDIDSRNKNQSEKMKIAANDWIPFRITIPHQFENFSTQVTITLLTGEKMQLPLQDLFTKILTANPLSANVDLQCTLGKPVLR